jgi:hypothetical protein
LGLIVLGLLLVATLLPPTIGGDGRERYSDLIKLLEQHDLYQPLSRYSLIGPLFSTPLYYIGKIFGNSYQWIIAYNLILFSLCLLIVYLLLRKYLDRGLLRKFFLVLIYGSMFANHLTRYYGEVFTALGVGFGVLMTFIVQPPSGETIKRPGPQRSSLLSILRVIPRYFYKTLGTPSAWGWLAVILGVANTQVTLVALAIVLLKRMLDSKRLRYILVIGGAGLLIGGEAWLRRGSPFSNGYSGDRGYKTIMPYSGLPGFSYPFFFGVLSILFSFGKGLIFFAPGLLLPVRKTLLQWQQKINIYEVYTLWMCFVVGLVVVYAQWWAWYGGGFWGPRFFLFAAIPASFALAVRLIRYKEVSWKINFLTFIVFCLSVWVSIDSSVFAGMVGNQICSQHKYALEMLCWYTPEFSVLWLPFVLHPSMNSSQLIICACSLLAATYLVAPLFIYMLRQCWQSLKEWGRNNLSWQSWRI